LCATCGGDASLPYGGHRPYAADPHSNAAPRIAAQVLHAVMDGATCGRHLPDAGPHRDAVPDPSPCAQIPGRHRPLVGRRRAAAGATCGDGRCDLWSAPTGRRSTSGCSTGSQPMRSDPRSPLAAGGATACSGGRCVR